MRFLASLFVALGLPLALGLGLAATASAELRVEYRDNARPIRLALPGEGVGVERVEVFVRGPGRVGALVREGSRNPTRWAHDEGRALPGLKFLAGGYARYGDPDSAALALYWSNDDHHGKVTWRRPPADPKRLRAIAEDLSETWTGTRDGGWLGLAARLPEGSMLQFHFHALPATLQVFGGSAEAGRREADQRLRMALAQGEGWEPMQGMHSPSWRAPPESPVGAVMIAGPVLAVTANPGGIETMELLARIIERPLPRPPEVGEDPMGTPPKEDELPRTQRQLRWQERASP